MHAHIFTLNFEVVVEFFLLFAATEKRKKRIKLQHKDSCGNLCIGYNVISIENHEILGAHAPKRKPTDTETEYAMI